MMYHMTDEEIERNYVLPSVEYYIKTAKKEIIWFRKCLKKLIRQRKIIKKTRFKKIVTFTEDSRVEPVVYDIMLQNVPQIEDSRNVVYEKLAHRIFEGEATKKEALLYARALVKAYKAELVFE